MTNNATFHPRLISPVATVDGELVVARDGLEFVLSPEASSLDEIRAFLGRLDGRRSLDDLMADLSPDARARFSSVVENLDELLVLDDASPAAAVRHGLDVLERLVSAGVLDWDRLVSTNVLWQRLRDPAACPIGVVRGLVLETYYLWFQSAGFDVSASRVCNAPARRLLRELMASLSVDEDLLLELLSGLGVSAQDLADARVLPTTLTFANALSFWSRSHPVVIMTALEILPRALPTAADYAQVLERHGLLPGAAPSPAVIDARRARAHLGRRLLADVDHIDAEAADRLRIHVRTFAEMLDTFFTGIWNHYSVSSALVRHLSDL